MCFTKMGEKHKDKRNKNWGIKTQGGVKKSSSRVVKGDPRGTAVCQAGVERANQSRVEQVTDPQEGGFLRLLTSMECLVYLNVLG